MNLVIFTFDLKKQILKNPVKMTPCNIYPSILIKPQLIGMSNCCITHLSIACVLFLLQTFVPPDRTFHVSFCCLFWYWWNACDSFEIFLLFTLQSKHVQQLIMHNNYLTFAWHIKGLLIFSKHNRYVYAKFIIVYDLTYKLMLFFSMWIRMWLVKGLERCAHFGPLWTFIKKS